MYIFTCLHAYIMALASSPAGPVLAGAVLQRISQLRMRRTLNYKSAIFWGETFSHTPCQTTYEVLAISLYMHMHLLNVVHVYIHHSLFKFKSREHTVSGTSL